MYDVSKIALELMLSLQAFVYGTIPPPPAIVLVEPAKLQEMVCHKTCAVRAWYSPDGKIYIDSKLDPEKDLFAKSILVHELVHHIQRSVLGKRAGNCKEWIGREREAYSIQVRWLRSHGKRAGYLLRQANLIQCNPEKLS